jgi:hypothetical protein
MTKKAAQGNIRASACTKIRGNHQIYWETPVNSSCCTAPNPTIGISTRTKALQDFGNQEFGNGSAAEQA